MPPPPEPPAPVLTGEDAPQVRVDGGPAPAGVDLAVVPASVPAPRPAPARRGRAGLSRDRVVAEAARLADETADARVLLATVADRLGVRLPSLYKHVAGVEGLRRGLARFAAESLRTALAGPPPGPPAPPVAPPLAPSAAPSAAPPAAPPVGPLALLAGGYRAWALAHPGLHAALLDRPHPDDPEHAAAVAAVTETFASAAQAHGLTDPDALVDAVRFVRGTLHGFCALEIAGCLGGAAGVDRSFARVVAALEAALRPTTPTTPTAPTAPTG